MINFTLKIFIYINFRSFSLHSLTYKVKLLNLVAHVDRKFLEGLAVYGKGDWISIARNSVMTKTSTQVASHAQKYFRRQKLQEKDKKRASIHDITTAELLPPTNIYRRQGGGGGGGGGGGRA